MPMAMGTARLQHLNWDLDVREKALWNASLWREWCLMSEVGKTRMECVIDNSRMKQTQKSTKHTC